MHDDKSKSMNSRAFSCGERSVVTQPFGKGCPVSSPNGMPASFVAPEDTCRSLYTTRPHCAPASTSRGVLNVMYSTAVWPGGDVFGFCSVIHCCAPTPAEFKLCFG